MKNASPFERPFFYLLKTMKQITSLLQHTSLEKWANILIRRFDVHIGLVTANVQIFMLGQPISRQFEMPTREMWITWFEQSNIQKSPFVNSDTSALQSIAVPIHGNLMEPCAIFASGFDMQRTETRNRHVIGQEDFRLVIEMLMEMASKLEVQCRKTDVNAETKNTQFEHECERIVAKSQEMMSILRYVDDICELHSPVFIHGEIGTGKKKIAQWIHQRSAQKHGPFMVLNCAVLPEQQLESELFGHKRGAILGALTDKAGLLYVAQNGTLVLEDIDALSLALQLKLLHFLEEGTFTALGDDLMRSANVRIIMTSQTSLKDKVDAGLFRPELYYCLNRFVITVPPLKDRREDILALCHRLLAQKCAMHQIPLKSLSAEAAHILYQYDWPGNIRELENEMHRLVILAPGEVTIHQDCISARILQAYERAQQAQTVTLHAQEAVKNATYTPQLLEDFALKPGQTLEAAMHEIEKRILTLALAQNQGNRTKTAEVLGISRRNLIRKIENMKIEG